jgi:hypothetical protein
MLLPCALEQAAWLSKVSPTSRDEHPPYTMHRASYPCTKPAAPRRSHVRACALPGVKVPRIAPALLIACGAHRA